MSRSGRVPPPARHGAIILHGDECTTHIAHAVHAALELVLDLWQPRRDLITPLFIQEGLRILSPAVEPEVGQ